MFATGECLAATHDNRSAWDCYQRAMKVIDRLWFALLEEDKLQQFFHEKARLYDRAAVCLPLSAGRAPRRYAGHAVTTKRVLHPRAALCETVRDGKRIHSLRLAG